MKKKLLWAQGDMIIEQVTDVSSVTGMVITPDPDGSAVIGRGEVSGHRHRFALEDRVTMFRDDNLARECPKELYVGHIKVGDAGASLVHEEHDTINIPPGTYRIRRQREYSAKDVRIVAD